MHEKISRRVALAAAAAAGLAGTASAGAAREDDAAFNRIEARMTTLAGRAPSLNPRQKCCAVFAAAAAAGSPALFYALARSALKAGVTAVEVKEILYQAAPYVGMSRVAAALPEVNRAFREAGVAPAPDQTTVTDETRLAKGIEVQTAIFGDVIGRMHAAAAPEEKALLIDDLSGWCFGDFYTRGGLSIADRELVTFAAIAALGGCEAQLRAHAAANVREGATRANLIDALQAALPYMGFPRTLNALAVVKEVAKA